MSEVTKERVELMIRDAIDPIKQDVARIVTVQSEIYGNGSGRQGYLERTKEAQDKVNVEVLSKLSTLELTLSTYTGASSAVHKDRREWLRTGLILLGILTDILIRHFK
jgi:hypothetical protein